MVVMCVAFVTICTAAFRINTGTQVCEESWGKLSKHILAVESKLRSSAQNVDVLSFFTF